MDKNLNKEVAFCPGGTELLLMYIIAVTLFVISVSAIIHIADTIFSGFQSVHWIQFIAEVIFVIICSPVIFAVMDSETLYINRAKRYFKLKKRIINFDDISGFKYKFGYNSFPQKSPFSITFTLFLYSGEDVSFDVYFFGFEKIISDRLQEVGIGKF
ncbi:MAG: hypothetical protein ACI37S_08890 [Candidatus Gastranaerophilaceae bacterium]